MPRGEREGRLPTLWQLEALRVASESDNWDDVVAQLGVGSKHQVLRTVARLQEKLGMQRGLLLDRDNKPYVPDALDPLVDEVRNILTGWRAAVARASESQRSYFLRIDGYWSHIANFAGSAVADFQPAATTSRSTVRIELVPGYGDKRDVDGAGMVSDLLPPNPRADFVMAPEDPGSPPAGVEGRRLYRWALVAAIHRRHPLQRRVENGRLDVATLVGHRLAAAPRGHRSRELLEGFQSVARRFDIHIVSEEPGALIALGHETDIVPVIPSDSVLPVGPWIPSRTAGRGSSLPPWWPCLVDDDGRPVEGAYSAYWRTENSPRGMPAICADLADRLGSAAQTLEARAVALIGAQPDPARRPSI